MPVRMVSWCGRSWMPRVKCKDGDERDKQRCSSSILTRLRQGARIVQWSTSASQPPIYLTSTTLESCRLTKEIYWKTDQSRINMAGEIDYGENVRDLSGQVRIITHQPAFVGPYSIIYRGKLKNNNQLVRMRYHWGSRLAQWLLHRLLSKP
jgi:hypothetical protein